MTSWPCSASSAAATRRVHAAAHRGQHRTRCMRRAVAARRHARTPRAARVSAIARPARRRPRRRWWCVRARTAARTPPARAARPSRSAPARARPRRSRTPRRPRPRRRGRRAPSAGGRCARRGTRRSPCSAAAARARRGPRRRGRARAARPRSARAARAAARARPPRSRAASSAASAEADDAGQVLGAAAAAVLVGAAAEQRLERRVAPHHQRADALRAAELVRRDHQVVGAERVRRRPATLPAACTASQWTRMPRARARAGDLGDRLQHAGLVVGEHHATAPWCRPAARPPRAGSMRPSRVDRQVLDRAARAAQHLGRAVHRVVLDGRDRDARPRASQRPRRADHARA